MSLLDVIPPAPWLAAALIGVGALALLLPLALLPAELPEPQLRGYRLTQRREALAESALLRLAWPAIRLCTHYAERLPLVEWKAKKSLLLRRAGEPWGLDADEYLGLILFGTLVGLAGSAACALLFDMGAGVVILGTFLGVALPQLWLSERATGRLAKINRGLPAALDLIVLAMGAGLDFVGALRHVVDKWTDQKDPLLKELKRCLHELGLGRTRHEALEDFAFRAPTELCKAFVANVVQAEARGTPLVDVLRIQADVARTVRFQTAEKVAGRAGVILLGPMMLIFTSTVLVMFGGLIVRAMRGQLF